MIKSKIAEHGISEINSKYPCLMHDRRRVVMFSSEGEGAVVHAKDENSALLVGKHFLTWRMSDFAEFKGSVTLEQ